MLRLIDVCKSFKYGKNNVLILNKINLDFKKSELVFIVGKSGCGKTTLLNIIGGLLDVDSGKIMLDDKDISKFDNKMLCNYRNNMVGFIFQDYHLIEYMSVLDNVKLGQTICDTNNNIDDILRMLGIFDKRNVKVNRLSGGEKQRVAIARAIINNPDIILCDEPTGALDSANSVKIMEILKKISVNKLVIVVSHDNVLANQYADRIINMVDGKVEYIGQEDDNKFREIKRKRIKLSSIINLSFKNLCLKKWRTLFTSLAISLGFVCMLLVLCLSKSFSSDIDNLEKEIVSSFPISVSNGEFEIINDNIIKSDDRIIMKNKDDYIYENKIVSEYIDYINDIDEISSISYDYDISMPIISDRYKELDNKYMKMLSSSMFIDNNYKLLYGRNISKYNEIILKVDNYNNVDEELLDVFDIKDDVLYSDLVGRKLRVICNDLYYAKDGDYYFVNNNLMDIYKNSEIELEIVGIVKENEIVDNSSYFYYDSDLIDYVLNVNSDSRIVLEQLDKDYNILGIDMDRDKLLSYLGYNTLPSGINMYVDNIDDKEKVISKLDEYNSNNKKLIYIDTMQDAIDILKDIINIITVILVVFSMISIMVSSFMILILTNNRIMERIKEIGILRSLGARDSDISRLFNIENLILGIISSCIGIFVVYIMKEPINNIMEVLVDGEGIFLIYSDLVIITVIFNIMIVVLSGYIPTKIASKKKVVDCIDNR